MPGKLPVACPECGMSLKAVDPYKHAVACFGLPDRGAAAILNILGNRRDEYADRVKAIILPLLEKE